MGLSTVVAVRGLRKAAIRGVEWPCDTVHCLVRAKKRPCGECDTIYQYLLNVTYTC